MAFTSYLSRSPDPNSTHSRSHRTHPSKAPQALDPDLEPLSNSPRGSNSSTNGVAVISLHKQNCSSGLSHDILDVVFLSIADETGDGILHLNFEIFEAEEIYGPPGRGKIFRDEAVEVTGVLEEVADVPEEAVYSGHGDYEDAGDYFECFEGVGIASDYDDAGDYFDCFEGVGIVAQTLKYMHNFEIFEAASWNCSISWNRQYSAKFGSAC